MAHGCLERVVSGFSNYGEGCGQILYKNEFVMDLKKGNLVPSSLVDEAKGEIWSNPICTRDRQSGMWQAIKEPFSKVLILILRGSLKSL